MYSKEAVSSVGVVGVGVGEGDWLSYRRAGGGGGRGDCQGSHGSCSCPLVTFYIQVSHPLLQHSCLLNLEAC